MNNALGLQERPSHIINLADEMTLALVFALALALALPEMR